MAKTFYSRAVEKDYISLDGIPLQGGKTYYIPRHFIGRDELKEGIRMDPNPSKNEDHWDAITSNGKRIKVNLGLARKLTLKEP